MPEPVAPAGFVVRDHRAAAPAGRQHGRGRVQRGAVVERHADGLLAAGAGQNSRDAAVLEHVDVRVLGHQRGELADHAPPRGRATGVHHSTGAVAPFEPECQLPVAICVEAHTEPPEVLHGTRRLLARAPVPPTRGRSRGRRRSCPPGAPVDCRWRRSRLRHRPAPRSWRRRRAGWPRSAPREPRARRAQSRVHARRAGADGDQLDATPPGQGQVRYVRWRRRLCSCTHPSSLEHDPGPHPEQPAPDRCRDRGTRAPRLAGLHPRAVAGSATRSAARRSP